MSVATCGGCGSDDVSLYPNGRHLWCCRCFQLLCVREEDLEQVKRFLQEKGRYEDDGARGD